MKIFPFLCVVGLASLFTDLCGGAALPLLSWYRMNGNGQDSLAHSPAMELDNVKFSRQALQLPGPDYANYIAEAFIPNLNYSNFTVAVDFAPCSVDSSHSTILSGGPGYRWLTVGVDPWGRLQLELNNGNYLYSFTNQISSNRWHTLVCSVELAEQRIVVFLDRRQVDVVPLFNFTFNSIGTDYEWSDKTFLFRDLGDATILCGYVDNLRIYDRALTAAEVQRVRVHPPTRISLPTRARVQ